MKLLSKRLIALYLVVTGICILFLVGFFLPQILDLSVKKLAEKGGLPTPKFSVEEVGMKATKIRNFSLDLQDINTSVDELNFLYQPADLAFGRINAVSLTKPEIQVHLPRFLEKVLLNTQKFETNSSLEESISTAISSPPIRFVRLRDGSIDVHDDFKSLQGSISLEADLYDQLAQFRADGNFSGMPWSAQITSVLENSDIFLSAQVHIPELEKLIPFFDSVPMISDDIFPDTMPVKVQAGSGFTQWTGRVMGDGVIDQFFELNASDILLDVYGLSLSLPRSLVFFTPRSSDDWDFNLYTNLKWGENLEVNGFNLRASMESGNLGLNSRLNTLVTRGILPNAEIVGLSMDTIKLSHDAEGAVIGLERLDARFSAVHFESGLFNLYDGQLTVKWLGENRFQIDLLRANASLPTLGINMEGLSYSGEVNFDELPDLAKIQNFSAREVFIGEDQKIEDVQISFTKDNAMRFDFSKIEGKLEDIKFSMDPANLVIELSEGTHDSLSLLLLDSEIVVHDEEEHKFKKIRGNLKFSQLDPLETNGSQSLSFDLDTFGREFPNGKVGFAVLPNGDKVIDSAEIELFGGAVMMDRVVVGEVMDGTELRIEARGLISQQILNSFDDLDADMDGNLSGVVSLRKLPVTGWDFYGGSLSLDSSDQAHLSLNLHGVLTDGLNPDQAEYANMELLEKALADLDLDSLKVNFKLLEDGERVVEMNVIGASMVERKRISVEYRPRIIGGLKTLLDQLDFSRQGNSALDR